MSELQHHGVKGQKWGVRRYQNADGTLTGAGRKRLATQIKKNYEKPVTGESDYQKLYKKRSRTTNSDAIKMILNNEQLRSARKKLMDTYDQYRKEHDEYEVKKAKLATEFYNNPDVMFPYKVKAYKDYFGEDGRKFSKNDLYLMYEDWDQGDNDSLSMYVKDRGLKEPSYKSVAAARDQYYEISKTVTRDLLQEFGDIKIKDRIKHVDSTVNDVIADAIKHIDLVTDYGRNTN